MAMLLLEAEVDLRQGGGLGALAVVETDAWTEWLLLDGSLVFLLLQLLTSVFSSTPSWNVW